MTSESDRAQTHPEALVSKLAEAMESIFDQWQPPESYERMAARAVLDLFEVREEHGIDPARPFSEQLSAGSMRAAGIPDAEKPTHRRYTLTTDWEPTDDN